MYYPLLRGRQNELLAIKELLLEDALSDKIIPVIEPVKLSPTFVSTIECFANCDRELIIIGNPSVGSFDSDAKNPKNKKYLDRLNVLIEESDFIKRGIIVGKKTPELLTTWRMEGICNEDIIALCLNPDNVRYYEEVFSMEKPAATIVPYLPAYRRIRENRISIEDKFNKKSRNKDYADNVDEFFSEDHLYYSEDNYIGFSDYSIVGDEYSESGFAPYAVVIHVVYFDEENKLRIHHFLSKDNEDISDPANKFYQALTELIAWNKEKKIDTVAMRHFEEIYQKESYPGLGMVKRLSIMNHLELVGKYLDGALK